MNERTDHEGRAFTFLRSANPVKVEDIRRELNEERLAAARARAFATVEKPQPVVERLVAAHSPKGARRVGLLGAAAAAATAVTLALTGLVPVLPGGSEPATALRVLNAAASIAAAQPATAPGPSEYLYVKQRLGVIGGPSETVEWWIASDGSGRMRRSGAHTTGVMTYEDERGAVRRVIVKGHDRTAHDATFGPGRFAEFYEKVNPGVLDGRIDELPTDPQTLKAVLLHKLREALDFNPDPATQSLQMLQLLEEVLANPLAPPKLRGAVYDIAARLEGVEIKERVTDPVGRAATAIALCSDAIPARYEVFFDLATSATLGTREVNSVPCNDVSSPSSGLSSYSVYLEHATVDSIHKRP
jgi:hypothetical protein